MMMVVYHQKIFVYLATASHRTNALFKVFFHGVRRESNCRPMSKSLFARFVYRTSLRYLVSTSLTLTQKRVASGFLVITLSNKF